MHQVDQMESVAGRLESDGAAELAPILRRSAFVLAVAALDSYFHERGIRLLHTAAQKSPDRARIVAEYIAGVEAETIAGSSGDARIRLRLSFKTLVAPTAINKLLAAASCDAELIWTEVAVAQKNRPERMQALLGILYDRRNQIAHEADWDPANLDFRPMDRANLRDCVAHVTAVVEGMDVELASRC